MRMLIVDDSRVMRKFLGAIAKELTFTTDEACDGASALARLSEAEPFDVALFDWDMPNMTGIELLEAVRTRAKYDGMRIMMVTSQNSMKSVQQAILKGANDYLMKPVTRAVLAEKLRMLGVLE